MNASKFMDKQIMDLSMSASSSSSRNKEFIDLMNHPSSKREDDGEEGNDGIGVQKEEIMPSYDFHPVRPNSQPAGSARVWNSVDSKSNFSTSPIRNYSSLDSMAPTKANLDKEHNVFDATVASEIDKTMKKYTDNLLHALEGVSARLTQLESRTRHLEESVDDLKVSVGNNHGSTDGKMRHVENILREVQTSVEVLKDKQDMVGAQLQLAKLQFSKADKHSEAQDTAHVDSVQQAASLPMQSHQTAPSATPSPLLPTLPPLVPPPLLPTQNAPSPLQLPSQFPQNPSPSISQRNPYFQSSGQTQALPTQQNQLVPTQQTHPPPTGLPNQQYQMPQPQYSQPSQQHPPLAPITSQLQPSLSHPSEESYASQNYPPNIRQATYQPSSGPPSQQFYGAPAMNEPQPNRSSSEFSPRYGPPSEPYSYGAPPSIYGGNSAMKPQLSSPLMVQSGGGSYPQLPTAQVLPQALPTASGIAGSGSRSESRVPIDDVVDKVTSMGFPRDHVRATVRKLKDSGQPVDLNAVLDKLMNDGEVQPPRGWFGR